MSRVCIFVVVLLTTCASGMPQMNPVYFHPPPRPFWRFPASFGQQRGFPPHLMFNTRIQQPIVLNHQQFELPQVPYASNRANYRPMSAPFSQQGIHPNSAPFRRISPPVHRGGVVPYTFYFPSQRIGTCQRIGYHFHNRIGRDTRSQRNRKDHKEQATEATLSQLTKEKKHY